jgi:hypothetical protein
MPLAVPRCCPQKDADLQANTGGYSDSRLWGQRWAVRLPSGISRVDA